jgi:hypothetical protein
MFKVFLNSMSSSQDPSSSNFENKSPKNPTGQQMNEGIERGKCYRCKKETPIKCKKCQTFCCSNHSFYINHALFCEPHFIEEKRVGILKSSAILSVIIIGAIIVLLILR